MKFLRTLSYTLLLLGSTNAFTLIFYVGKECNGEEVGAVSNVDGTCTSTGLDGTNAESVEIQKDTSDPSGGQIAFHTPSDCTGQTIIMLPSGCVNIDTAGLKANSYRMDTPQSDDEVIDELTDQLPVSLATMLFQFPSEDDPFFKRFFLITAFSIEVIIEVFLPVLLAFVLVVAIALLCANMLGLTQNPPDETTGQQTVREGRADSADLAQAVDEKTLLNIEMKILEEMLQTRRMRLNGLAKSD